MKPRPHLAFGVLLVPKVSWPVLRENAEQAERLGFDSVWIDDHLANPARPGQDWLEAWTTLAALAAVTTRVRLGSLVSTPVVRHPLLLARQALTVEQISRGRLDVGLGSGYAALDHELAGQPPWSPEERADRFAEAVALVDHVLRGEPVPPGRYYRADAPPLRPRPVQRPRPPLTVAARGRRAMLAAARHGDAWSTFGGFGLTGPEHVARTAAQVRRIEAACEETGRDPATLRRSLLIGSPAVSTENPWAGPDAFADFAGRYRAAGIDEFVLYWPPQDHWPHERIDPGAVERIATEVIPVLRVSG
ncbi:LLM class flavin-dependent oxidoreductase [Nonomuraea wenchangensis]